MPTLTKLRDDIPFWTPAMIAGFIGLSSDTVNRRYLQMVDRKLIDPIESKERVWPLEQAQRLADYCQTRRRS